MIKGIHHVTLVVCDLDAAQRYYGAIAGMKPLPGAGAAALAVVDRQIGGMGFDHCLLAGRNGYLLLVAPHWTAGAPAPVANPINRPGIRHFCVQNHDVAPLATAVAAQGGSLIAAPLDLGTGNQYAYARDPEDNIMEIEGLPYAPVGEPTWLAHVALVTRDMDAAVTFYSALFATEPNSRGRFGPGPQLDRMGGLVDAQLEGAWLPAGNLQLELWQFHTPTSPTEPARHPFDSGYGRLCLESDDLDADAARLVALGGALLTESLESDRLRAILGSDPEGNLIEIVELRTAGAALAIAALADPDICARVEAGR
ncbi:VOC family protein [Sphingomonas sp. SUN039]|uniref:VOC family protein n=1 Tax=Sphingomonas sp. SUN039 TaxID=2937787 RepID=UPI002164034D|nr:VOC family protein [Sphingomonas sp. SUN039]UVO55300.1 VOC family protein [Sphingomonas sp. SUN039]